MEKNDLKLDLNVLRRLALLQKPNGDLYPSESIPHTYQLSLHIIGLIQNLEARISMLENSISIPSPAYVKEPMKETVKETVQEPMKETVKEPVKETKEEPVQEQVKETKDEPMKEDRPIPKIKRSMSMGPSSMLAQKKLIKTTQSRPSFKSQQDPIDKKELDLLLLKEKIDQHKQGDCKLTRSSSQIVLSSSSKAQVGTWNVEDVCDDCVKIKSENFKKKLSDNRKQKLTTTARSKNVVTAERAKEIKSFVQELDEIKQGKGVNHDTRDLQRRKNLKEVLDEASNNKKGVSVSLYL